MASEPTLVNNLGKDLAYGRGFLFTEELLKYVDDVSDAENVTYTIDVAPNRGRLAVDGVELTPGFEYPATFTQADIANGRISYTQFGVSAVFNSPLTTAVNFTVKDEANNTLTGQTFPIRIFRVTGRRAHNRFRF